MVQVINLPSVDNSQGRGMNVTVRGLSPAGIDMRNVKIISGRWFEAGRREIVVGKSVAKRYPQAQIGQRLRFGRGDWEVVGVMDGGQSAVNSEMWGDLNQISSDYNRQDTLSSILVRVTDAAALPALINAINDDRQVNL
jgi:putative ABC transport system permease protein